RYYAVADEEHQAREMIYGDKSDPTKVTGVKNNDDWYEYFDNELEVMTQHARDEAPDGYRNHLSSLMDRLIEDDLTKYGGRDEYNKVMAVVKEGGEDADQKAVEDEILDIAV
ncbi:hypothetical protein JCM11641_001813, partial [Rhodosporidiobolus odoratus]